MLHSDTFHNIQLGNGSVSNFTMAKPVGLGLGTSAIKTSCCTLLYWNTNKTGNEVSFVVNYIVRKSSRNSFSEKK